MVFLIQILGPEFLQQAKTTERAAVVKRVKFRASDFILGMRFVEEGIREMAIH